MKRLPTSVLLGTQPKIEEQELSSTGGSLDNELNSEEVNKTLTECLQLAEQVFSLLPTNSMHRTLQNGSIVDVRIRCRGLIAPEIELYHRILLIAGGISWCSTLLTCRTTQCNQTIMVTSQSRRAIQ